MHCVWSNIDHGAATTLKLNYILAISFTFIISEILRLNLLTIVN